MAQKKRFDVLCEDEKSYQFVRGYLQRRFGKQTVQTSRVDVPYGLGSGEQSVRERFATELCARRTKPKDENLWLVVMTDADQLTHEDRLSQLQAALEKRSVHPVGSDERVLVFIPKRNIESWARWGETGQVDETQDHKNQYRDGGKKYGAQVAQRCLGSSNDPGPRSIQKACEEIQRVV